MLADALSCISEEKKLWSLAGGHRDLLPIGLDKGRWLI
jgi:hypothetical protein